MALCRYAGPGVEHWVQYAVGADARQEPHLHRAPRAVEPGADQRLALEYLPSALSKRSAVHVQIAWCLCPVVLLCRRSIQ